MCYSTRWQPSLTGPKHFSSKSVSCWYMKLEILSSFETSGTYYTTYRRETLVHYVKQNLNSDVKLQRERKKKREVQQRRMTDIKRKDNIPQHITTSVPSLCTNESVGVSCTISVNLFTDPASPGARRRFLSENMTLILSTIAFRA